MLKSMPFYAMLALSVFAGGESRADTDAIANLLKTLVKPQTEIIFMGEDHRSLHQAALKRNLIALHSAFDNFDCLFLELEAGAYQSAINAYLAGRASFNDSVMKAECAYQEKAGIHCIPGQIQSNATKEALDTAKLYGVHVFAADANRSAETLRRIYQAQYAEYAAQHPELHSQPQNQPAPPVQPIDHETMDVEQLYKRNIFMSEIVKETFKMGACHRAAFQVGSAHIFFSGYLPKSQLNVLSIPKLLQRDGIRTQAFLMSEDEATLKTDLIQQGTRNSCALAYDGFIFYSKNKPRVYARIYDF